MNPCGKIRQKIFEWVIQSVAYCTRIEPDF